MAYESLSNHDLHLGSLAAAKDYLSSEALLLGFLTEMHRRRAFYDFECTGIWDYCHRLLKLGEAQSYYFQKVARKAVEVPALKEAVENGTLTLSEARRIEPVITKSTSETWIQKAATLPQKELEREVQKANLNATGSKEKPFEKTLRRLMDVLGKSREEVLALALALEQLAERVDPERKAKRAALSSRKPKTVRIPRGRRPTPAGVKHAVVREKGYRCEVCGSSRYLHFHHKVPVARGGLSLPSNLQILCSAHHAMEHRRNVSGTST